MPGIVIGTSEIGVVRLSGRGAEMSSGTADTSTRIDRENVLHGRIGRTKELCIIRVALHVMSAGSLAES